MNRVCSFCKGSRIEGIHLPSDFDDRKDSADGKVFLAKCDACFKYSSDSEAAEVVAKLMGWTICRSFDYADALSGKERAEKQGTTYYRPFFAVTLAEAEAVHGTNRQPF